MIFYTANANEPFFPKAALAALAGQPIELAYTEQGFGVVVPAGIDWADYEPQPDLEIPQPDREIPQPPIEIPQPDIDGVPQPSVFELQPSLFEPQETLIVPQPDLRHARDPWTYYQQELGAQIPQPDAATVAAWRPVPEPEPEPSAPLTDVDIARNYANAYQAAQDIIFLLMGRVAPALVIGKHFTEETVNKEGSRFTRYHKDEIEAFKLAGRHPDAGDALYAAVEASAGIFPWLTANNGLILNIFATTLPRNSK